MYWENSDVLMAVKQSGKRYLWNALDIFIKGWSWAKAWIYYGTPIGYLKVVLNSYYELDVYNIMADRFYFFCIPCI